MSDGIASDGTSRRQGRSLLQDEIASAAEQRDSKGLSGEVSPGAEDAGGPVLESASEGGVSGCRLEECISGADALPQ